MSSWPAEKTKSPRRYFGGNGVKGRGDALGLVRRQQSHFSQHAHVGLAGGDVLPVQMAIDRYRFGEALHTIDRWDRQIDHPRFCSSVGPKCPCLSRQQRLWGRFSTCLRSRGRLKTCPTHCWAFMHTDLQPEFLELLLVDRRRRPGHEIASALVLGERDHVPDVARAREDHR